MDRLFNKSLQMKYGEIIDLIAASEMFTEGKEALVVKSIMSDSHPIPEGAVRKLDDNVYVIEKMGDMDTAGIL